MNNLPWDQDEDFGAPLLSKMNPAPPDFGPPLLSKQNPQPVDPSELPDIDFSKLQKQSDDANRTKALLGIGGAIGDALSSQQSVGNFMTGHTNAPSTAASSAAAAASGAIDDPLQRQAKLYALYKGKQDADASDAEAEDTSDLHDPDSDKSKMFRAAVLSTSPSIAKAMGPNFDSLTAADKDLVFDPIKLKETIDQRKEATAAKLAAQQMASEDRQDRVAQKASAAQADSYQKLRKDMESFRGNQAVQQAAKNGLAADNALKLVDGKDLNSLSSQEIRLFTDELGKIATSGVPGEHGVEALMPNTAASGIAGIKSFFANNPTPAQAGEFLKKNVSYLKDLKDVSGDMVNGYRDGIAKGYKNKVASGDYDEAIGDFGLRGYVPKGRRDGTPAMNSQNGGGGSGAGGSQAPQDPQVASYAAKHNLTYAQAAAIKAQRTSQVGAR